MNKKLIKLAAISSMVLVLAGCNNNGSSVSNSTSDEQEQTQLTFDTSKEVKITFYHTMNQNLKEILDVRIEREFNVMYPNIVVENFSAGGYDDVCDQLATSISAGETVCDMAYCYPDHVALYNKAKSAVPLDKYMYDTQVDENGNLLYCYSKAQIDDFVDAYWEEGKSFGDCLMYSLPLSKSSEVMFYDKTFFEEHELNVPTHWFPLTENVDDDPYSVEYVCKKIKEIDPTSIPLGYDSESNWFITMCEQYGSPYTSATGDHFLFNNDKNKEFVTRFKAWFDKGYFTTQNIYGGYTSGLFCNTTDTTAARSFMSIGSSAGAKHQLPDVAGAFEVGIASIPQVNPDAGKVISQGPSLVMFKKADQQEVVASWLLMRFLTTDIEFQASMSMSSGYVPGIEAVMENDVYLEWLDSASGTADGIAALSASVCMQQADRYFTSPAFVGSSDARDQVGSLLQSVFQGQQTVDEAFEFAISECLAGQK